jgi:hypothetical protein
MSTDGGSVSCICMCFAAHACASHLQLSIAYACAFPQSTAVVSVWASTFNVHKLCYQFHVAPAIVVCLCLASYTVRTTLHGLALHSLVAL